MKMRLIGLFLFAILLMVSGCDDSSTNKIDGIWTIDMEATLDASPNLQIMMKGSSDEKKEQLAKEFDDSAIIIDVTRGTMSGKMAGTELPEESFTILSEGDDFVIIKEQSGKEKTFNIIDKNTISVDDSGVTLVLKRK